MFTLDRIRTAACVAMISLAVACGGGGGDIINPTPTPTPNPIVPAPPALVSVSVRGPSTIVVGASTPYRVVAKYSDGSEVDVTSQVTCASDFMDTVASGCILTPIIEGVPINLTATFSNLVGSMKVTVVPIPGTPWSQLAPLSSQEKSYVVGNIGTSGLINHWRQGTQVKVWAPTSINRAVLDSAVRFLNDSLPELRLVFAVVTDSVAANVWINFGPNVACGKGGPSRISPTGEIETGQITFAAPFCVSIGNVAHELVHVLGFTIHSPRGTDLMSPAVEGLFFSAAVKRAIVWMTSQSFPTRPI